MLPARDRGLPRFFHHVDKRFQSPIRTIWLAVTLAFILALPSLGSIVAFAAATSIATIGLYLSYGMPILIGLIYHKNFKKGPFNLRAFSRPVAIVACLWIGFITIIFCLPNVNPVTSQTLNYTPVAVGIVCLWTFGTWFLSARKVSRMYDRVFWLIFGIVRPWLTEMTIESGSLDRFARFKQRNSALISTNRAPWSKCRRRASSVNL